MSNLEKLSSYRLDRATSARVEGLHIALDDLPGFPAEVRAQRLNARPRLEHERRCSGAQIVEHLRAGSVVE